MKLMNNIMVDHQALPEEMLTKKQVFLIKFMLWQESRLEIFLLFRL